MSQTNGAASLWPTRLLWAALGAGVATIILWNRAPPADATTPVAVVAPPATPPTTPEPLPSVNGSSTSGSTDLASSSEGTGTGVDGSSSTDTSGTGDSIGTTTGIVEATAGEDDEALSLIPLPRMPGSRFMRRARRPSDDGPGELITLGLSVPAPGAQVESFYRSALKDEDMKVFGGGSGGEMISQGYRSTLKARGRHANAEVTVHQRAGKLRSVVRIYWRTKE